MASPTKIAELDKIGNVVQLLETDRPLEDVLGDELNEGRKLVAWPGDVADEEAYTRRYTSDGEWVNSSDSFRKKTERARADALAEYEAQQEEIDVAPQ